MVLTTYSLSSHSSGWTHSSSWIFSWNVFPRQNRLFQVWFPAPSLICTGASDGVPKQTYLIAESRSASCQPPQELLLSSFPIPLRGRCFFFELECIIFLWSIYVSLGKIWSIFPGCRELLEQFDDFLDNYYKHEAKVLLQGLDHGVWWDKAKTELCKLPPKTSQV